MSNKIINYGFEIFNSRDLRIIFKDLRFRNLEILDSSWGYWFLVQGLMWQFSTFTLVLVTHLTELFNVRDWSDNGSAESGTSLYLIRSQGHMWQQGAESGTKVTIYSLKIWGLAKKVASRGKVWATSFVCLRLNYTLEFSK